MGRHLTPGPSPRPRRRGWLRKRQFRIMATSHSSKNGHGTPSMFSLEEPPVRHSASPDSERAWMIRVATWPSPTLQLLNDLLPPGSFGKMCPASFPAGQMCRVVRRLKHQKTCDERLKQQLARPDLTPTQRAALENLKRLTSPTILTASSPALGNSGMVAPSSALTLNTSVWRNGASVCLLSDTLEAPGSVPPRYFLTVKACQGILRRAAKRGKTLPAQLEAALRAVACGPAPSMATAPT